MILPINISITPLLLFLLIGIFGILAIIIVLLLLKNENERRKNSIKLEKSLAFNTTLSHELRTPLYAVTAISKNLLQNSPKASQIEDLQILERASNYLVKLINDSLLLKKIDAKKLSHHQETFYLDRLVNQVSKTVEKQIAFSDVKIIIKIDPTIPNHLIGDPVKLSQILINLLNNAAKFGEKKPVYIEVVARNIYEKNCVICFKIIDHGKGILKEDQGKILKHFHQLESKNKSFGSGLGLPIVVALLKILNSELVIKSTVNKGSEFSFSLNFKINSKDITEKLKVDKTALKDLIVLVVDDNQINQVITIKTLEKIGVKAMPCHSGSEAIQLVASNSFDLVLMDLHMPVMTGEEATKKIRSTNKSIPIVALTALEKDNHWKELSDMGFSAMLHKPYEEEELYKVLLLARISGNAL
ncbi:response regulator [Flavobacteriaceae bacterium]|nr:response regulator [Flavobacteriaceae bacterium]